MLFNIKLAELRQKPDKSLVNYYKRILNLVNRFRDRNRPNIFLLNF